MNSATQLSNNWLKRLWKIIILVIGSQVVKIRKGERVILRNVLKNTLPNPIDMLLAVIQC